MTWVMRAALMAAVLVGLLLALRLGGGDEMVAGWLVSQPSHQSATSRPVSATMHPEMREQWQAMHGHFLDAETAAQRSRQRARLVAQQYPQLAGRLVAPTAARPGHQDDPQAESGAPTTAGDLGDHHPAATDERDWQLPSEPVAGIRAVELYGWGPAVTVAEARMGFALEQRHFADGHAEIANVSGGRYRVQFEGNTDAVLVDGQAVTDSTGPIIMGPQGLGVSFAEPVGVVLTPMDAVEAEDSITAPDGNG